MPVTETAHMVLQLVDVRRVKAHRREDLRIHRAPETQMAADADPHGAELAGARRVRLQESDHRAGIVVVSSERLVHLAPVSAIGSCAVVLRAPSRRARTRERSPAPPRRSHFLRAAPRCGESDPSLGKISEKRMIPGYRPSAAGRRTKVRIGPLGVSRSANSCSMIVIAKPLKGNGRTASMREPGRTTDASEAGAWC